MKKALSVVLLATGIFLSNLTNTYCQAKDLTSLDADYWYFTMTNTFEPAFLFVTGKNCKQCPAMQKLIEEAADLRSDVQFYMMTNDQLPIPDEMTPYVLFSVPGQNTILRGHGWMPDSVQDVMIFISQREAYAKREEAVTGRLRGFTAMKKIKEANKASDAEIAELVKELDLITAELNTLRSHNKQNAFGKPR